MILLFLKFLFLLIAVHAILDFPLQGDTVAINKNPNANTALQKHVPWGYWLSAHALSHGLGVWFITQSVWLGICETISHWIIDYLKCQGKYSIHMDQFLHLLSKIVWLIVAFIIY